MAAWGEEVQAARVRANVYRVSDPTSDTLTNLGYVTETGEVYRAEARAGRVTPEGAVLGADGAPAGYVTEAGAVYRAEALVGHAAREGSIYRGAALSPQAVVGYVDPRAARPHMGGAALLLGLFD